MSNIQKWREFKFFMKFTLNPPFPEFFYEAFVRQMTTQNDAPFLASILSGHLLIDELHFLSNLCINFPPIFTWNLETFEIFNQNLQIELSNFGGIFKREFKNF